VHISRCPSRSCAAGVNAEMLDKVLPDESGQVLHGLLPERDWALRERTRKDRAMLQWFEDVLAANGLESKTRCGCD
jgi:hypothetical protein